MSKASPASNTFAENAERTARAEQKIQSEIDKADKAHGSGKDKKPAPVQAGARAYPAEFPKQHLTKPGLEKDMKLRPMYGRRTTKGRTNCSTWSP
jgi:hypothetical protein